MAVIVDKAKCIGCGACTMECPFEALDIIDGVAVVDPAKCKDCTKCTKICPADALSMPERAKKPQEKTSETAQAASPDTKKVVKAQPVAGGDDWNGVWVIVEYINGNISQVSWELLGEGRKLADALEPNFVLL